MKKRKRTEKKKPFSNLQEKFWNEERRQNPEPLDYFAESFRSKLDFGLVAFSQNWTPRFFQVSFFQWMNTFWNFFLEGYWLMRKKIILWFALFGEIRDIFFGFHIKTWNLKFHVWVTFRMKNLKILQTHKISCSLKFFRLKNFLNFLLYFKINKWKKKLKIFFSGFLWSIRICWLKNGSEEVSLDLPDLKKGFSISEGNFYVW